MALSESAPHYDLCIVGAGIGGLNALYVASGYLRPHQRIALVDKKSRPGGMWVDTYDYVRLHQPHPFFTTGDVAWTFGKEPQYLATKAEVLEHFQHCVDVVRGRVELHELFEHEMLTVEEDEGIVRVSCKDADGRPVELTADRVIKASCLDVETNPPLGLTSTRVHSVSPNYCDMRTGEIANDDAPVWVIGSGKTAMDSITALLDQNPRREINLVAGSGTFFISRDKLYPLGRERWYRGTRPNKFITGMADRFDGTNEAEVFEWVRNNYGTQPTEQAEHFFLGLISEAEISRIKAGLRQVVMGHLDDVVDEGDSVRLMLDTGEHVEIAPGSWVVNCTGYLIYRDHVVNEPYVSPSGRFVSVGANAMFGFSSFAGYFLAHLLMLGKITEVPLYQADGNQLLKASKPATIAALVTVAQYNMGLTFDAVPAKVFQQCGLDFDRWYPVPRQLMGQIQFMATHKRKRERYRRALDTVTQRFGIDAGPVIKG